MIKWACFESESIETAFETLQASWAIKIELEALPMTVGSRSTKSARGTCLLLEVSLKNVPKVLEPPELEPASWGGGGGPVVR